ncbi:hypothetical protein C9374_004263 [Naegleria lovaniensis]|uniref:Uncharacterized protein n=1 Tax=Naegleria lovaniensis TaxID=51637 RepID=A0AA88GS61_NAELO|nr:uncharacterized protein C9374_004263 [Naegleria lovaniensis]KAG2383592.1 hypothetical protein C9374_004263 [Naegleria lovaniensis]
MKTVDDHDNTHLPLSNLSHNEVQHLPLEMIYSIIEFLPLRWLLSDTILILFKRLFRFEINHLITIPNDDASTIDPQLQSDDTSDKLCQLYFNLVLQRFNESKVLPIIYEIFHTILSHPHRRKLVLFWPYSDDGLRVLKCILGLSNDHEQPFTTLFSKKLQNPCSKDFTQKSERNGMEIDEEKLIWKYYVNTTSACTTTLTLFDLKYLYQFMTRYVVILLNASSLLEQDSNTTQSCLRSLQENIFTPFRVSSIDFDWIYCNDPLSQSSIVRDIVLKYQQQHHYDRPTSITPKVRIKGTLILRNGKIQLLDSKLVPLPTISTNRDDESITNSQTTHLATDIQKERCTSHTLTIPPYQCIPLLRFLMRTTHHRDDRTLLTELFLQQYWFPLLNDENGEMECIFQHRNDKFYFYELIAMYSQQETDFYTQYEIDSIQQIHVSLNPSKQQIRFRIYPKNIIGLGLNVGAMSLVLYLALRFNCLFNWRFSRKFLPEISWRGMVLMGFLDMTSGVFGYAAKALLTYSWGCFIPQHLTYFESWAYYLFVIYGIHIGQSALFRRYRYKQVEIPMKIVETNLN